jgi:hypothetical protein
MSLQTQFTPPTPSPEMSSADPRIIVDKKLISNGLYTLLECIRTTLSENLDIPALSAYYLPTSTKTLSSHVAEHHLSNLRHARDTLDTANLAFCVRGIRSLAKITMIDKARKINGEKDLY